MECCSGFLASRWRRRLRASGPPCSGARADADGAGGAAGRPAKPMPAVAAAVAQGATSNAAATREEVGIAAAEVVAAEAAPPVPSGGGRTIGDAFRVFCGPHPDMDGTTFARLCKDCQLTDRFCTATEVDIIFAKVATKGTRRIDLCQFQEALCLLAARKGADAGAVAQAVVRTEGPRMHRTTTPTSVRLHDDRRTYTGTHCRGGPDPGGKGKGAAPSQVWPAVMLSRAKSEANTPPVSPRTPQATPSKLHRNGCRGASHESLGRSPPQGPGSPGGQPTLESTFRAFRGPRPGLDSKTFAKICKEGNLLSGDLLAIDAELLFAKVMPRGQRSMGFEQFKVAMQAVATKKGMDINAVCRAVAALGGPVLHCTKADAVRLHDDKSTYTGTHVHGGPAAGRKSMSQSPQQLWCSSLRPAS